MSDHAKLARSILDTKEADIGEAELAACRAVHYWPGELYIQVIMLLARIGEPATVDSQRWRLARLYSELRAMVLSDSFKGDGAIAEFPGLDMPA